MAFSVIQAGSSLQILSTDGSLTTLSIPSTITLNAAAPPRWAVFGRYVILVNTPSAPLTIDGTGTVRPLCPKPPRLAPVLSAGAAGGLTGTYAGAAYTFIIKDAVGNIIAETDFSPLSNSVTIAAKLLVASGLDVSPDTITARRVYRPTTGGSTLFYWLDVDGNTVTTVTDDLSDAALGLVAAPTTLGTPPRLTLIAEYKGRLWGVGDTDIDDVVYSDAGLMYAWPEDNLIAIPRAGTDTRGITGLMARREALGVGRANLLFQITGSDEDDFRAIKITENCGIESQESVQVYRDTAFFLWKDGVYKWDSDGIACISDGEGGKGQVRSWFTTDSYFNRARFPYAFSQLDPIRLKYRLFLASPSSNSENRWIEYDIINKTWWGPHKTDAFTVKSAFTIVTSSGTDNPVIGATSGYVYQEQTTATDGSATGISLDVIAAAHDGGSADREHFWGELSMLGKAQSGGTLTITPTVGDISSTPQTGISYTMSNPRQRLRRLGHGRLARLRLTHSAAGEPVELYGYELPVHELGRR